jgi:ribosomal protein S12 methylthiotransferase
VALKEKVYLESLGCPKNLVDSESIAGHLHRGGFTFTTRREEASIIIVNTCAFIKEAVREAVGTITSLLQLKRNGACRTLVVAGCLPQRYGAAFFASRPELSNVDLVITPADLPRLAQLLRRHKAADSRCARSTVRRHASVTLRSAPRLRATPSHTAYLKIAEGCSHRCSFCTIPAIKGPYRSRSPRSIIAEAQRCVAQGAVEINLIAQDTTFYGRDRRTSADLATLVRRLCRIEGLRWIRLLYCHPDHFSKNLIAAVRDEEKVCCYLDLPLQHISDPVLKKMGRRKKSAGINKLITEMRKAIPSLWLRTTVMVGFPGETEADFSRLLDFIRETEFEHLGAFRYSDEEGTRALRMGEKIPPAVVEERYHRIMSAQSRISLKKNRSLIGSRQTVMVEGTDRTQGTAAGRTFFQAPEIDGIVYLTGGKVSPGAMVEATITGASEYDLYGEPVKPGKT